MFQFFDTLQDDSGNALLGATVAVTNYPSGTPASIYATNGTVSPIANSTVVADITGQVSFYAPDGAYSLAYAYKGTTYKTRQPVQLLDPMGFVAQTDTGSANNIVVAGSQLPAQLYPGLKLEAVIAATNTGATVLSFNGGANQPVHQPGGSALLSGMLQTGGISRFEWDGTQWQLVGVLSQPFYAIVAAETTAGVTIVNSAVPPGNIIRYGNNTTPGTTPMGAALQAAINVALAAQGNAKAGIAIYVPQGFYLIDTLPTFGTPAVAPLLPITIYGDGDSSQLKNGATAGSGFLFDMTGRNGWRMRDFLICGDSAHKNGGIKAGGVGGTEQVLWRVDRVTSFMAGIGFQASDTNDGVFNGCKHWPNNPPNYNATLQVAQTVATTDINHACLLTGGFTNLITIQDCEFNPNSSFAAGMRGILINSTSFQAVTIITCDVESASGADSETGIEIIPSGAGTNLAIITCYHEGTIMRLQNISLSNIGPLTNGGTTGSLVIVSGTRNNNFTGIQLGTLNISGSDCWGNTFMGCAFPTSFTDASDAANLSNVPNRYIGCQFPSVGQVTDLGADWRQILTWSTTIASNTWGPKIRVVRVPNGQAGTAFTISAPTNPRNGVTVIYTVRNETTGAMGVISWFGSQAGWVNPANGFNRSIAFYYDTDFNQWRQLWVGTVDVPN